MSNEGKVYVVVEKDFTCKGESLLVVTDSLESAKTYVGELYTKSIGKVQTGLETIWTAKIGYLAIKECNLLTEAKK